MAKSYKKRSSRHRKKSKSYRKHGGFSLSNLFKSKKQKELERQRARDEYKRVRSVYGQPQSFSPGRTSSVSAVSSPYLKEFGDDFPETEIYYDAVDSPKSYVNMSDDSAWGQAGGRYRKRKSSRHGKKRKSSKHGKKSKSHRKH
jgi:hypothetical protein